MNLSRLRSAMPIRGLGVLALAVLVGGCQSLPTPTTVFFGRQPRARTEVAPLPPPHVAAESQVIDRRLAAELGLPPIEPAAMPLSSPVAHPDNHVISRFGPRGRRMHRGIDIKAPRGTDVIATGDGTVTFAGWMRGFGQVVFVDHGQRVQTVYAHLDSMGVSKGATLRLGDRIGSLGRTGNATTHHVHYEVRIAGRPVNPERFLPFSDSHELASLDVNDRVGML